MRYFIIMCFSVMIGCKSVSKGSNENKELTASFIPKFTAGPQAYVYKTKSDYSNLVPILLNDEGTEIVSYPHPNDLKTGSGFPLPVSLSKGYLLDKRGINKNVAYINLTYQEYSNLKSAPTLKELFNIIIDKDPLTELCNCGNKTAFTDIEKQLNDLIKNNKLKSTCKIII